MNLHRMVLRSFPARALAAAFALLASGPAFAQSIDQNLWVTNGTVNAVAEAGGTIYIGGTFTQVGPATGGGVPLDTTSGAVPMSFPKVAGAVYAVVSDGAGGWYIGGQFSAVGGLARSNIAQVTSGMSVSAWNPGAGGTVSALAFGGSTVYAGGTFTTIGGQTRGNIAALDGTTGVATAWDPSATGTVWALAVSGGTVYAGGGFSSIGGQVRNRIAALDAVSGLATAWDPNANGQTRALAVSGGTVYAGGNFTSIGGQTRNSVAALDAVSGLATAWNPNASGTVLALAVSGGTVYAGGAFTTIGGQTRNRIAALDGASGLATAWNPNASSFVYGLAVSGGTVYAGGNFTTIGGQTRNRIAALDGASGLATAWDPNASGNVSALAVSGGTVYAGGGFTSIGGQPRNNIAALDATTGIATAWNPNASSTVYALTVSGGTVYAGGQFAAIGGQTRNNIAALDGASGLATAWNPSANGNVYALVVSGETVFAGGGFSSIGGQTRNKIAALDGVSGLATAWDPNASSFVYALAVSGGTVYAGGDFTTIGGQTRNKIAELDGASGLATAWNPDANNFVLALAVSGGTVYAGGNFTSIGAQTRNKIAALDGASGLATVWNPDANSVVYALAVSGGTVYAGGFFTSIGGQTRNRIVALDTASGLATAWNPNASNTVRALAVSGRTVYAGGDFTTIGGLPQASIAAIAAALVINAVQPASGGNAGVVTVTVTGQALVSGATVRLSRSAQPDILGTNVAVAADGLSLTAILNLTGTTTGLWDVIVTNPDLQTATLLNGFTIEAVEAPQLRVNIVGPARIRGNRRTAFDLVVENPGNVDAVAVPLWIAGIPLNVNTVEADFALASPPQAGGEPDWSQVPLTLTSGGGRYLALVIPRVPPGTTTRRIYLNVPAGSPVFQLRAALTPPWLDGATLRACVSDGGVISAPACMGAQLTAINAYLTANPQLEALSGIGLWAKIGWQCEGATTLNDAVLEAEQVLDFMVQPVEQTGSLPVSCGETLAPRWREVLAVAVVASIDPNDKLGARGMLSGQQAIPYEIRFENVGSAPAQRVTVADQLDLITLDPATVSVEAIKFGRRANGFPWTVYPPSANHATVVDLRPEYNVKVRVSVAFDPSGELTWSFVSLDPATGQPLPPESLEGFLPPNAVAPEGEGSLLFTVRPRAGLTTGTQISNDASILFDDPPALNTPGWLNGMDNTAPTSRVLPLDAIGDSARFTVRWEALGAPPDLRDFTIYVREDGGPFRVWRLNTVATADTFAGRDRGTYAFYSVARDTNGNIESSPGTPDTQTHPVVAVGAAATLQLALEGAQPNPARDEIHAWFTLADRAPATLELIDVSGRRVLRREVGSMGPGRHVLALGGGSLGGGSRLRPGLYFLRLAARQRVLSARVALMR